MELTEIRKEIDRLDGQILDLLCRRLDCSAEVAEYKAAHHLPVLDENREKQILNTVHERCNAYRDGYGNAASLIFAAMMDSSRALQHRKLGAGKDFLAQLAGAERHLLPAEKAGIVCQGVPGAYSDEAASRLFAGAKPRFVASFADVFTEVANGAADYGILPVENSSAGSVNEVYDLVMQHRFTIAAAAEVPVSHCLLARRGAKRESLKAVYSHEQGLAQCADYIAAHHLDTRPYANTAGAAKMVAASNDLSLCAIASRKAAEIYGLDIIDEDIQSATGNCTRFIVISRRLVIPSDANKISLIFALPHVTGSLYRTLSRFAIAGLNLTKLESRPIRGSRFEYIFYLDFEGSLFDQNTVDLLCGLSEEMPCFSFLGNYRELE